MQLPALSHFSLPPLLYLPPPTSHPFHPAPTLPFHPTEGFRLQTAPAPNQTKPFIITQPHHDRDPTLSDRPPAVESVLAALNSLIGVPRDLDCLYQGAKEGGKGGTAAERLCLCLCRVIDAAPFFSFVCGYMGWQRWQVLDAAGRLAGEVYLPTLLYSTLHRPARRGHLVT